MHHGYNTDWLFIAWTLHFLTIFHVVVVYCYHNYSVAVHRHPNLELSCILAYSYLVLELLTQFLYIQTDGPNAHLISEVYLLWYLIPFNPSSAHGFRDVCELLFDFVLRSGCASECFMPI